MTSYWDSITNAASRLSMCMERRFTKASDFVSLVSRFKATFWCPHLRNLFFGASANLVLKAFHLTALRSSLSSVHCKKKHYRKYDGGDIVVLYCREGRFIHISGATELCEAHGKMVSVAGHRVRVDDFISVRCPQRRLIESVP